MRNGLSKIFKTFAATTMTVVMLASGSLVAKASAENDNGIMPLDSDSYSITLKKGIPITISTSVEKSIANVAATVNMEKGIPADDLVTTYVVNLRGEIVSTESAKFRGTTSLTTGKMPYRSGTGNKGNRYRLTLSLNKSSKDDMLESVKCSFIP